jgi:hypothetical protein
MDHLTPASSMPVAEETALHHNTDPSTGLPTEVLSKPSEDAATPIPIVVNLVYVAFLP